jgi:hypothetical protein
MAEAIAYNQIFSGENTIPQKYEGPLGSQLTGAFWLLEFLPVHYDFLRFVNVALSVEPFTAVTRVRIPSGTPIKTKGLRVFSLPHLPAPVTLR